MKKTRNCFVEGNYCSRH